MFDPYQYDDQTGLLKRTNPCWAGFSGDRPMRLSVSFLFVNGIGWILMSSRLAVGLYYNPVLP